MPNIGAVILAAGESSRLGQPKQLLQFRGQTLIRRIADAANNAGCSRIVVVVGSDAAKIKNELDDVRFTIVENEVWRAGIGTSIRSGMKRLLGDGKDLNAIVLLVCDQPFVDRDTIAHLISIREKTKKAIVASRYADTLGVPALFDRSCFAELLALKNESGAKSVILSNRERVAEFPFPQGVTDIDTARDCDALKE